ncbi:MULTISPECIES: type II toxin-antitoxin system VapC family toxin [unclassified Adlercreutzia]|uniref:type II toxin-antitoxin system VapC family toxin n=1 Tax=unclassified Adlercreutzia TaxID=2636013 RepID=UPI0013EA35E0|nr:MULTISPECIES: type II toxin-antitoxin system VapC family toxin [unclassified Adlercreutzia]
MVVMDCSAAVNIALDNEKGNGLLMLLQPNEEIIAPTFFRIELRNSFWKYIVHGEMDELTAQERMTYAESLITKFVHTEDYMTEVFSQAVKFQHPVYDMLYLCMTRRNGATLFTLDQKLMQICREAKVNCTELVDF